MNIIKLSITRATLVVVIFATLVFFGIFSFQNLSKELFPKMTHPAMTVSAVYPGAGPAEVENSVTKKLEDAVASLEGIKSVSSTSMENYALIVLEFKAGTDLDKILQDAQRRINAIKQELPDDVKDPAIMKIDVSELPIMNIGVTSDMAETDFYDFVKNDIKPAMERIPGVASIQLSGGNEREIQVNIDRDKMEAYGLSVLQISQALISSNMEFPAGKIKDDDRQILIRLAGKYDQVGDIENVALKASDGGFIKVKNVAEVIDTQKETTTVNRVNGVSTIGISVQRQTDANAVAVAEEVKTVLSTMEKRYADKGFRFDIVKNDSDFTVEASDSVIKDLILAILFVAIFMFFFLQSVRNSLIVFLAIPASLISTCIAMYLFGFTLNLMSLLALSLVIGILVDDAIVVIENIHRHLEMGKNRVQATYEGLKEIGGTVVSITLVLVVVFVPISLTQSLMSELFRQFCVTAAVATLFSLFVSFTLVPMLSSRISKLERVDSDKMLGKMILAFEAFVNRLAEQTAKMLQWAFGHKVVTLGATLMLFVAAVALIPAGFIGTELAGMGDKGEFYIEMELPKSATIEQTDDAALKAESIIRSSAYVSSVYTTVGSSADMMGGENTKAYYAELFVKLIPHNQRNMSTTDFAREVKLTLQQQIVDAKITTAQTTFGIKDDAPIELRLVGNNLDTLIAAAASVRNRISAIPGLIDAKSSVEAGNPEIKILPDRDKMATLGISLDRLGMALNNAFSGNQDAKFKKDNNEWDINIRLDPADRRHISDVENFSLINSSGKNVSLKQFAQVEESESPLRLERSNRVSSVSVTGQVSGRPVGTVGEEIKQAVAQMDFPESVSVEYGGDLETQDEAFGTVGFALIVSILLVYLIMVVLYDDYIKPFVVLFSIPLALIGALIALALSMQTLSLFSLLGMVMLVGLVAKNAIIVVDFAGQLQQEGREVKAALLEATRKRFRPVVMTTLSTIIGMLPIALAKGAGAEWKNGLAWVLIGGLISSMLLTLVVVPLVYYLMDRVLEKTGLNKRKKITVD